MDYTTLNRSYKLCTMLYALIAEQEDTPDRDESLDFERIHAAASMRTGYLLALERGADAELAACAAAIHDIGRIVTGRQKDHAANGEAPAKKLLTDSGLFSEDEIALIVAAVRNHSSKTVVGTPIEEIVKDADVIDCYQYGMPFDRPEKETRYNAWLKK